MKRILFSIGLTITAIGVSAQNVGIGATSFTPNDDALLELRSTTSGFLLPKMTEAQKNAIATPTEGLIVYQTNATKGFKYFNGTTWAEFGGAADNFGSHIAEMNISLDDKWLSNDGGNEGIRISDDGNVGIGVANPTSMLQLNGDFKFSENADRTVSLQQSSTNGERGYDLTIKAGDSYFGGSEAGGGNLVLQAGTQHDADASDQNSSNVIIKAGVNNLSGGLSTNEGEVRFETNGTERMQIQSNGNVGIGTTSPAAKLHTTGSVRMETLSGSGTRMVVADNLGNVSTQAIPSGGGGFGSGTTLNLNLTNDVTSQNVSGVSIIRLDSNNSSNEIKGLSGGVAGQIICIVNTDPNHKVKFKKDEGTQRFREDVEVDKKDGAIIMYDGSYWYVLSRH